MITVANRATPRPLTLEQQENAMTSEGTSPVGQMPKPAPPTESQSAKRVTLQLPSDSHSALVDGTS